MHYNKQKKINTINKEIIIFCLKCSRIPLVSINNSKRVRIICKCRVTNCSFVQYMNTLKYSNDLYYKIKIKLGYPEYYTKLNNRGMKNGT